MEVAARKRSGCPDTPPRARRRGRAARVPRGSQLRFIKGFLRRLAPKGPAPRLWLLLGTPCRATPRRAVPVLSTRQCVAMRCICRSNAPLPLRRPGKPAELAEAPSLLGSPQLGAGRGLLGAGTKPRVTACPADAARRCSVKPGVGFCRGAGWVTRCSSPLPAPSSLLPGPVGAGGGLGRGTGVGSAAGPHPSVVVPRRSWQGCTQSPLVRRGHFGVPHLVTQDQRCGQGCWLLSCLPFPGNGMEWDPGSASALSLAHG